jgi:hypothetical protein
MNKKQDSDDKAMVLIMIFVLAMLVVNTIGILA